MVRITERRNPGFGCGDEEGKRGERHENQQETPDGGQFWPNWIQSDENTQGHNNEANAIGDLIGSIGLVPFSVDGFQFAFLFV